MKRLSIARGFALAVLGLLGQVVAQVQLTPSSYVTQAVAFVGSPDAKGSIDRQQVRLCFSVLMQRLKIPEKELPNVLVIHASPEVARIAGVPATMVRRSTSTSSKFYEVWIVGQPQVTDYIRCFYSVFENHFAIEIPTEQRKETARFVMRFITNTVSVQSGQ